MKPKNLSLHSRVSALGLATVALWAVSCGTGSVENSNSEIATYGGKKDNGTFTSSVAIMKIYRKAGWVVGCTATKIARNILLTAAHCVVKSDEPVEKKFLRPIFEPGTIQRIATGQNATTGKTQDLKILSVDFYPGFKERYQLCQKDCRGIYTIGRYLPTDLKVHYPDMAVITYNEEIGNATTAAIGEFNNHDSLSVSGYGVNDSQAETEQKSKNNGDAFSLHEGDKRFITFIPAKFTDLITNLKRLVFPSVSDLDEDPKFFAPAELNMAIFAKFRDPISHAVFKKFDATPDDESIIKSMPPIITGGYTMIGDSGGGYFKAAGKSQTIVGVVSLMFGELRDLPTHYFSVAPAITKNPLLNTHKWLTDLIKKNELKTTSKR